MVGLWSDCEGLFVTLIVISLFFRLPLGVRARRPSMLWALVACLAWSEPVACFSVSWGHLYIEWESFLCSAGCACPVACVLYDL